MKVRPRETCGHEGDRDGRRGERGKERRKKKEGKRGRKRDLGEGCKRKEERER